MTATTPEPTDSPSINLSYNWEPALLKRGFHLHAKLMFNPVFRWTIRGLGLMAFLMSLRAATWGQWGAAGFFLVMASYFLFLRGPVNTAVAVAKFRRRPDAGVQVQWTLNRARIVCRRDEDNEARFTWNNLVKALIAPDTLLLYPLERVFYILPREAVSDAEWEQITGWAREQVPRIKEIGRG